MTHPPLAWCGVDVGTQGVRAVVVDAAGITLGAGSRPLPGGRREGWRHEQDPATWWEALVPAVADAVQAAGVVELQALALDSTSGTVLVEARDGAAQGPALMYDDTRAVAESVRAQEAGAELWAVLGHRMQPSWALPKVLWLLASGSLRRGDRVVHQSDHLVRRLTGAVVATDSSHALKTGVDLRTGTWPTALLADLGVPAGLLPEVVAPGTVLGRVGAAAAGSTGLPWGLPVRAGMTDGCAAQIASGALAPGAWSSALGTTLVVKGSTTHLVRDPSGAVYSHRSPDGGWLPGGASSTGAGALTAALPGADLEALTAAAAELEVPGVVCYPLAGNGERFPFVAPGAHGFSDGASAGPAEQFSALCHGIAYVERLAYDVLGALGADVSGPVSASGGSTANPWWTQLRSDVLGRPVLLPESVQAATGMAVLAAAEPGHLAETAERMVRIRARVEPRTDRATELRVGYERLVGALVERSWLDGDLARRALTVGIPHQVAW